MSDLVGFVIRSQVARFLPKGAGLMDLVAQMSGRVNAHRKASEDIPPAATAESPGKPVRRTTRNTARNTKSNSKP